MVFLITVFSIHQRKQVAGLVTLNAGWEA